jgi:gluconokinase
VAVAQIVVMGVAGAGKTTVAEHLARRLGCALAEADEFHSPANVAKMAAGTPLTDADRQPWLAAIGAWIAEQDRAGRTAVVTCSALKRAYRDRLRAASPHVLFVHLTGAPELLAARLAARRGHFMPPALLGSQLATLEPLGPDERGIALDVAAPAEALAAQAAAFAGAPPGPRSGGA